MEITCLFDFQPPELVNYNSPGELLKRQSQIIRIKKIGGGTQNSYILKYKIRKNPIMSNVFRDIIKDIPSIKPKQ